MKNFYVTTPIYYPSAKLHLGHAYTTIAADVLKKYKSSLGYNTYFLTGTDEHGEKIAKKAEEANLTPQEFTDGFAKEIKQLWKLLDVDYDKFIRTTDEEHVSQVQFIFEKLLNQGDIYKGEYEGKYCTSCESFFTETQLNEGSCPDCGGTVKIIKEESYFFNCNKYVDQLLKHMDENEDFILPKSRKNELINSFIKPGLQDLAVTRTNFKWGVEVKSDPSHVIYVWIDALSNYITALKFNEETPEFKDFWPADVQLVGKEIIRFHVIYWPMMLMALGLPLPKQVFAHGWLLMDSDKMSKSKGNVIYSEFLVEKYGVDALRYYLMREVPFGDDGHFTPTTFVNRINNDIVNDLGNLVNRTISMVNKYFDGNLNYNKALVDEITTQNHIDFDNIVTEVAANMDKLQFSRALECIWKYISASNKFVDLTAPWTLAKDESKRDELEAVLYVLVESCRKIAILIYPFLNRTAKFIMEGINITSDFKYTELDEIVQSYTVTAEPQVLMQRLDVEAEVNIIKENMQANMKNAKASIQVEENVDFDTFKSVIMKVGKVLTCKKHPDANKLLVFELDFATETRTIVSGLAEHYDVDSLIGKNLVVVTNLAPRKIRGVLSNGMILTSEKDKQVFVVEANSDSEIGCVIQ